MDRREVAGIEKFPNNQAKPNIAEQKLEESQSPKEEATQEANLADYKIKVLNGSGIAGEAAKLKDLLEQEGFSVESIGNADKNDYEKTVIKTNKEVSPDVIKKLNEFLQKSYTVSEVEDLAGTEENNILIIIGREKTPQ